VTSPDWSHEALQYCLAERLASDYGSPIDPRTLDMIRDAHDSIRRATIRPVAVSLDRLPVGSANRGIDFTDY
jgi:hypothetical protein